MAEDSMTDVDFFTRETWRRGKKSRLRKRRKPYGGRKTAPAAFLEAAKMRLIMAWQTPGWHVLVRQIQLRNI
jgi:hypothetical protein